MTHNPRHPFERRTKTTLCRFCPSEFEVLEKVARRKKTTPTTVATEYAREGIEAERGKKEGGK